MSGRLDMWSRRKAAVAAEEEAARRSLEVEAEAAREAEFSEMPEAEVLAALDLPDPDTLGPGDDFAAFMDKAVPEVIRRRALRSLWRSNPLLANVDMLVDYGEDFTDAATVVENLQTTYQVGKGMLKHIEEMARQADEETAPAQEDPDEAPEGDDEELQAEVEETEPVYDNPLHDEADMAEAAPAPRRMTFRIEETA